MTEGIRPDAAELTAERTAEPTAEQVVFLLRVRVDHVERYLEAHRHVWPEMREALHRVGWADYSLSIDRTTGLAVGVLTTDDFTAAQERMSAEDVDARWQRAMREHMSPVEPGDEPGAIRLLEPYFHNA